MTSLCISLFDLKKKIGRAEQYLHYIINIQHPAHTPQGSNGEWKLPLLWENGIPCTEISLLLFKLSLVNDVYFGFKYTKCSSLLNRRNKENCCSLYMIK